ncbi:hypothetical protein [Saccharothrix luteola]|jgi:hypothetical protein|uniref:hypothetical protein n=1 Tax=Saccharothrix luteola TaxID=2893018 RepID=UPI001E2F075C|nr:hypothetical protein [Saccharothrix luteola]MCC8251123.1 hypothetical protein [Saccharothrix luteola]
MRSLRATESVIAGLGLLVLVVFGFVVPSARAGELEMNGVVVTLSILVSAILLVFAGIWGPGGKR